MSLQDLVIGLNRNDSCPGKCNYSFTVKSNTRLIESAAGKLETSSLQVFEQTLVP